MADTKYAYLIFDATGGLLFKTVYSSLEKAQHDAMVHVGICCKNGCHKETKVYPIGPDITAVRATHRLSTKWCPTGSDFAQIIKVIVEG
jgi:hypothetical protein